MPNEYLVNALCVATLYKKLSVNEHFNCEALGVFLSPSCWWWCKYASMHMCFWSNSTQNKEVQQ